MITCRHDSMTGLLNEKHFPQAQEFEYLAPVVCAVWGVSVSRGGLVLHVYRPSDSKRKAEGLSTLFLMPQSTMLEPSSLEIHCRLKTSNS